MIMKSVLNPELSEHCIVTAGPLMEKCMSYVQQHNCVHVTLVISILCSNVPIVPIIPNILNVPIVPNILNVPIVPIVPNVPTVPIVLY